MEEQAADVAVVGGGPAGAVAAIRLADLGHRVILLERAPFPRHHVGEALGPGVKAQLGLLGLADLAERTGGLAFGGSMLRWGTERWEARPAHPDAVAVDRARFDAALLDEAARRGAVVLQPAKARRAVRTKTGWRIEVEAGERRHAVACRFLVDASGRSGFLDRRRRRGAPRTFALHAYWHGRVPVRPAVAAGADHWLWASPVPGLGCSIMTFVDKDGLRRRRADLEGGYRADLAAAGLLGAGAAAAGAVRVHDAAAYEAAICAGADWLKIGEAAFALDPLSSSGVQKAIATALLGAVVVNTVLRRPADAAAALDFYRDEQRRTAEQHQVWAGGVYREHRRHADAPFWAARAAAAAEEEPPSPQPAAPLRADERLALAPDARFEEVATVGAEFIEPRLGIVHPAASRPIAFVGDIALAPILRRHLPATAGELAARLTETAPAPALAALERLVRAGMLSSSPG
jgi:flavin-dependent dehydrogenase